MNNFFLGASVFFFTAALALCCYSCCLLNRSIYILRYSMNLMERMNRESQKEVLRKEGTE